MGIFIPRGRCVFCEPNSDLSDSRPPPRVWMGDEIMGLLFPETLVAAAPSHSSGREEAILIVSPWQMLSLGIPGAKYHFCVFNSL